MKKWNKGSLKDLITLNYGKSLPERDRIEGLIPVYGSGGISGYHNKALVNKPSIIIGRKGSIGTVQYSECGFFPIDTVFYVTLNNKETDLRFVYYLLQQLNLKSLNTDAAVPGLNRDVAYSQKIIYPNHSTQKQIAKILSNYDDLIENNNKRIKVLEEMAQKIYKEWFVDFKFPGHETTTLKDCALGTILTPQKGKNITKSTIRDGNVPVAAGGLTPSYYHDTSNTKAPVITISASGANAGYVNLYHIDVWASDCSYIDKTITKTVYYYYLLLKSNQVEITNMQLGAAQPHVYPRDIARLKIQNIDKAIIETFDKLVTPFFAEIKILTLKNQTLKRIRDMLLPKLISGEINVENLEIV